MKYLGLLLFTTFIANSSFAAEPLKGIAGVWQGACVPGPENSYAKSRITTIEISESHLEEKQIEVSYADEKCTKFHHAQASNWTINSQGTSYLSKDLNQIELIFVPMSDQFLYLKNSEKDGHVGVDDIDIIGKTVDEIVTMLKADDRVTEVPDRNDSLRGLREYYDIQTAVGEGDDKVLFFGKVGAKNSSGYPVEIDQENPYKRIVK